MKTFFYTSYYYYSLNFIGSGVHNSIRNAAVCELRAVIGTRWCVCVRVYDDLNVVFLLICFILFAIFMYYYYYFFWAVCVTTQSRRPETDFSKFVPVAFHRAIQKTESRWLRSPARCCSLGWHRPTKGLTIACVFFFSSA